MRRLFDEPAKKIERIEKVSFVLMTIGCLIWIVIEFMNCDYWDDFILDFFDDAYYMPILVWGANYLRTLLVLAFAELVENSKSK